MKHNNFYRMQKHLFFLLLVVFSISSVYSQDSNQSSLDDMFLDESFADESSDDDPNEEFLQDDTSAVGEELSIEESEQKDFDTNILEPSASLNPTKQLKFSLSEKAKYIHENDNSIHNKKNLHYISPWTNEITLNTFARYVNKQQFFELKFDSNVYFSMASNEDTTDIKTIQNDFRYELKEIMMRVSFWEKLLSLRLGKIYRTFGSSYVYNPSNPLRRSYGSDYMFAKNINVQNFDTAKISSISLERETGTQEDIGYWSTELELSIFPIVWRIAYLPKIQFGFNEFDRPEHSFLTTLNIIAWDDVQPSALLYVYGDKVFTGTDVSFGVGDQLTFHAELGLSFENELMILRKTSSSKFGPTLSLQNYSLSQYDTEGFYANSILGMIYTPDFDGVSWFSMLVELYYNGKGLWDDEWNTQLDYLEDIQAVYNYTKQQSSLSSLSEIYKGIHNISRYYYDPLQARPLYIIMRFWRDDILSQFWIEKLNIGTSLVYSIIDTTFSWTIEQAIVLSDIVTIGLDMNYHFGLPKGAFTELSEVFSGSLYTSIKY